MNLSEKKFIELIDRKDMEVPVRVSGENLPSQKPKSLSKRERFLQGAYQVLIFLNQDPLVFLHHLAIMMRTLNQDLQSLDHLGRRLYLLQLRRIFALTEVSTTRLL